MCLLFNHSPEVLIFLSAYVLMLTFCFLWDGEVIERGGGGGGGG